MLGNPKQHLSHVVVPADPIDKSALAISSAMLSTPILNPPQTAILGMHAIKERPVAVNGEVVIRPMMYLALSYDHRLIDGKTAVQFLVTVKELLEDPSRILLQL